MYEKVKTVTTNSNFESRQGGGRKSQGAPKAGKPHSRQRAPHQTLMDSGGPDFLEKSGPPESIRV